MPCRNSRLRRLSFPAKPPVSNLTPDIRPIPFSPARNGAVSPTSNPAETREDKGQKIFPIPSKGNSRGLDPPLKADFAGCWLVRQGSPCLSALNNLITLRDFRFSLLLISLLRTVSKRDDAEH